MTGPSLSQQNAIAYAPKPFAALSFVSSSYVIYDLVYEQPEKRKRMYHRLVLTMHTSALFQSFATFWGTWAVPRGTPNYIGAYGNTKTCTAQGFIILTFGITVAFYYASLSINSFLAVKHRFREEEYKWIEKWIHMSACFLPLALATYATIEDNIKPNGAICSLTVAPSSCYNDPDIPCQLDDNTPVFVFAITQLIVYFIIPLLAMVSILISIIKNQKEIRTSKGMQLLIESARKRMLFDVAAQIGLYLFSFWSTYILMISNVLKTRINGEMDYDLTIVACCFYSSQGLIVMMVYFCLRKKPKLIYRSKSAVPVSTTSRLNFRPSDFSSESCSNLNNTVSDIRSKAIAKEQIDTHNKADCDSMYSPLFQFHIFDGTPSEDSPWAQYFYPSEDIDEEKGTDHPVNCDTNENN